MIYIGIDPGKQGAIALLRESGALIHPMPLVKCAQGRDEYDLAGIKEILTWGGFTSSPFGLMNQVAKFATVERAVPLPPKMPGGTIANFNRGVQRGFEWLLAGLEIPHQAVMARTWQKVMHAGLSGSDTKQKSILAAQRLFPAVDLRRTEKSRKLDDGMAEALLLAEYGRRTYSR